MGRDTAQLETVVNTISLEYLLEFTSEYGIPETLHPELPGPEDRIVDFPEGKVGGGCHSAKGRGRLLPNVTPSHWTLSKTETIASFGSTRECSRPSWTGGRMPPKTGCRLRAHMDLFNLIRAPNPTKVKTGSRPRAPHEVPLLTLTTTRVIEMDDPAAATDSSGVTSTIERSPLDFALEAGASDQGTVAPEMPPSKDVPATDVTGAGQAEETVATDPPAAPESRKRGRDGTDASVTRIRCPSLTIHHVIPRMLPSTAAAGDPESENASSPVEVGSPESIYRPEWGVVNGNLLDTPEACQDLVDHVAPPGYFFELRHLHNDEFLRRYNVNLARQVAMGSQLRLRFEQEAKLLRKVQATLRRPVKQRCVEMDACPDALSIDFDEELYPHMLTAIAGHRWVIGRGLRLAVMKCGESLELRQAFDDVAETNTKKAAEDRSAELSQELENMHAQFSDLQRCVEMDACPDALSIDFDEELYPHMLTAIAGHRWVIGRGLRLAVMKCGESLELRQAFDDVVSAGIVKGLSEGLRHGLEHGQAQLSLESIKAYDPEVEAKFVTALRALKDLKYPLVDQLEGLKDTPMDVIMAALYLESDTGDDAPQDIRDLLLSSPSLCTQRYVTPGTLGLEGRNGGRYCGKH
nr:hypothetical protein [Tanacetum cinerariifolium]